MSQYNFGNLESPLSGTTFFNMHLEPWRDALHSTHKGTARPSYAVAGLMWLKDTTTPWVLNIFDGTDDIGIGTVNATTNKFTPYGTRLDNATGSNPTVNDDSADGYTVGSTWVNTTSKVSFVLTDSSVGAAIWKEIVDSNSTQALSGKSFASITITGGTITGITDLAVADGGTGSSTASGARGNLGAAASGANTDITSLSGVAISGGSISNTTTVAGYRPTGSGYSAAATLALTDAGKFLYLDHATGFTLTVPPNASVAFPIGTEIDCWQSNAGTITVAPGSGVTIYAAGNRLKTNVQNSTFTLKKYDTNVWVLAGDMKA